MKIQIGYLHRMFAVHTPWNIYKTRVNRKHSLYYMGKMWLVSGEKIATTIPLSLDSDNGTIYTLVPGVIRR